MDVRFIFGSVGFFVGMLVGWLTERNHLKSLEEREAVTKDFFLTDLKRLPEGEVSNAMPGTMVHGEVVIATDRFKDFIAGWVRLFGGEIKVYNKMAMRARREALLRMIANAKAQGFDAVSNVRVESSNIGGAGMGQQPAIMCAIMAYGTAYKRQSNQA